MENSTKTEAQRKHFLKAAFFFVCFSTNALEKCHLEPFEQAKSPFVRSMKKKLNLTVIRKDLENQMMGKKISVLLN